jgi:hypothetical protein
MQTSSNTFFHIACSILLIVLFEHPSHSEMYNSERPTPGDPIIEDIYQPGTGLPVGKIQSVRGSAVVFHRNHSAGYRAQTGLPLYEGDTIRTLAQARILYRLVDGSKIIQAPATILQIVRSNYNSTRKTSSLSLSLKQGEARFRVPISSEFFSSAYTVQTAAVFVDTQQADFVVRADRNRTTVTTFGESRLEVSKTENPEKILFLADYQQTAVGKGMDSPQVAAITPEEADALMLEFSILPESKLFASSAEKYDAEAVAEGAIAPVDDAEIQSAPPEL